MSTNGYQCHDHSTHKVKFKVPDMLFTLDGSRIPATEENIIKTAKEFLQYARSLAEQKGGSHENVC